MNAVRIIMTMTICCLIGGCPMKAQSHEPSDQWISIQNPDKEFSISFPKVPVQMDFDLPKENSLYKGHLTVYSAPTERGVMMLGLISSNQLTEEILQSEAFKKIFFKSLVRWVFHQPKAFNCQQTYHQKKGQFQGHPSLQFDFTYQDHQVQRTISGHAVLKDQTLYVLFEQAPKGQDSQLLKPFCESLRWSS